jgi:hypothetical protein
MKYEMKFLNQKEQEMAKSATKGSVESILLSTVSQLRERLYGSASRNDEITKQWVTTSTLNKGLEEQVEKLKKENETLSRSVKRRREYIRQLACELKEAKKEKPNFFQRFIDSLEFRKTFSGTPIRELPLEPSNLKDSTIHNMNDLKNALSIPEYDPMGMPLDYELDAYGIREFSYNGLIRDQNDKLVGFVRFWLNFQNGVYETNPKFIKVSENGNRDSFNNSTLILKSRRHDTESFRFHVKNFAELEKYGIFFTGAPK